LAIIARALSQIQLRVRKESNLKINKIAIFWQHAGIYCVNMAISEKKFLDVFGAFFIKRKKFFV
jgi:hypothetical protein